MKNLGWLVMAISACSLLGAQGSPAKRPPVTGIAHVGLAAQDVQADRVFYTKTLGWTAAASLENQGGTRFFGDESQAVEVTHASTPSEPAFNHLAFATSDAEQMRSYLAAKGIKVPDAVSTWSDGTKSLHVKDPEGNAIEFVQSPRSMTGAARNRDAISSRIIHAGFVVRNAAAENRFYKDVLGFRLYWTGGMKDGVIDFVSLQVPDGTDWLEYMLNVGPHPSRQQLGV
jgi:catechol 2,3-dioxygenase-like lactoylglutathione lyase family enzyme